MALVNVPALQFNNSAIFGTRPKPFISFQMQTKSLTKKPLVIEARANARKESAKIQNRRMRKKEGAQRVGEELIKACIDLNINEISWYDRNGFARGQKMQAFETAIALHGFLPG